jgi:hypothetical protein
MMPRQRAEPSQWSVAHSAKEGRLAEHTYSWRGGERALAYFDRDRSTWPPSGTFASRGLFLRFLRRRIASHSYMTEVSRNVDDERLLRTGTARFLRFLVEHIARTVPYSFM